MRLYLPGAVTVLGILFSTSAFTAPITFDFGTGSNVFSVWPGTSNASNSTSGVVIANPLFLHLGELEITGGGGNTLCAQGVTAGTCGTSTGLTTGTAYGLGVADGRLDGAETITLALLNSSYTVKLISFSLSGFNGTEQATYDIDGTPTTVSAPVTNVALDTFTVNGVAGTAFTNSVVWSMPAGNGGNYALSSITLDVTGSPVPEPATMVLIGLSLVGLGLAYRRKRA